MLSAYTGYNRDLIDLCRQQLIKSGRILFEDGYYIFTRQDYVKPSAGRDTTKIYEREYSKLPASVRHLIETNTLVESTGSTTGTSSGTSTGHNNKHIDNNKHNNKTNNNAVVVYDPSAVRLSSALQVSVQENYPFVKLKQQDYGKWTADIEKIHRLDGYDWNVIEMVLKWSQQDDFWKQNIRSGAKFRKQFERLLIAAKADHDKQQKHGVTII